MKPGLLLALLILVTPVLADDVIHREKSLYRNILVTEQMHKRCLMFSVKRRRTNQTCIDTRDPQKIIFPYVRMTFAGLLAYPEPESLLLIGLGGGTIPSLLKDLYPDMKMDLIEVDEAVVKVAREYFHFQETGNMNVVVADGRVFTRRTLLQNKKYDLIFLDAYNGEYIPEHLMTREFLADIKSLLSDDGIVIANTFAISRLYDHESVTYESVFGNFINFKMPGTGNRVIIAGNKELPDPMVLTERAEQFKERLAPYDVDLTKFIRYLTTDRDWNPERRVLTDQYSPANLLTGD